MTKTKEEENKCCFYCVVEEVPDGVEGNTVLLSEPRCSYQDCICHSEVSKCDCKPDLGSDGNTYHKSNCSLVAHTQQEEWKEKLKEEWHIRSVNMAREVRDYSKVEDLIADWWLDKMEAREIEVREEIAKEIELLKSDKEYRGESTPLGSFNRGLDMAMEIAKKQ